MEPVPEAARRALEEARVELAILFGSTARGTAGPSSDIDIGVVFRGPTSLRDRLDLAVVLERALGREVDLVVLDEATPLLRAEAARGRCVLEVRPGAFGDFVSRALFEEDDVRPHFLRGARGLLRKRPGGP